MSVRQRLSLVALALAAFVFNSSEFMPVALLTDIAASFRITEAHAGMMMSVYAWAVMLLSLPLMIIGSRFDYRRLLFAVMVCFCAGQVASAVAPSFVLLIAARLVVAAAHAVFWSIATPAAARIAGADRAPFALSMVAAGSSVSMVLGLPLGRVVGLALGWRMTFTCVALLAFAILLGFFATLQRMEAGAPFSLSKLPDLARNASLVVVYAVTILVATGYYVGYSYIEPFLQQVAGMSESTTTWVLTAFGLAGIAGSVLNSAFAGRRQAQQVCVALACIAVALLLLRASAAFVAAPFAVCALWGVGSTLFNVAFQACVIGVTSPDQTAVAMSIYSGLFNLGIGTGAYAGGAVITVAGIEWVGLVGGLGVAAGLALYVLAHSRSGISPQR